MAALKAVCIVAHPDDCLIFARPYILSNPYNWTIVYLTYEHDHPRAVEVANYWNRVGVKTTFLGYLDLPVDFETNTVTFDADQTLAKIKGAVVNAEILLTHDAHGDYGHIHHKFVHSVASQLEIPTVFFARTSHFNIECECTKLELDNFPIHNETLQMFPNIHLGRYYGNNYW